MGFGCGYGKIFPSKKVRKKSHDQNGQGFSSHDQMGHGKCCKKWSVDLRVMMVYDGRRCVW